MVMDGYGFMPETRRLECLEERAPSAGLVYRHPDMPEVGTMHLLPQFLCLIPR